MPFFRKKIFRRGSKFAKPSLKIKKKAQPLTPFEKYALKIMLFNALKGGAVFEKSTAEIINAGMGFGLYSFVFGKEYKELFHWATGGLYSESFRQAAAGDLLCLVGLYAFHAALQTQLEQFIRDVFSVVSMAPPMFKEIAQSKQTYNEFFSRVMSPQADKCEAKNIPTVSPAVIGDAAKGIGDIEKADRFYDIFSICVGLLYCGYDIYTASNWSEYFLSLLEHPTRLWRTFYLARKLIGYFPFSIRQYADVEDLFSRFFETGVNFRDAFLAMFNGGRVLDIPASDHVSNIFKYEWNRNELMFEDDVLDDEKINLLERALAKFSWLRVTLTFHDNGSHALVMTYPKLLSKAQWENFEEVMEEYFSKPMLEVALPDEVVLPDAHGDKPLKNSALDEVDGNKSEASQKVEKNKPRKKHKKARGLKQENGEVSEKFDASAEVDRCLPAKKSSLELAKISPAPSLVKYRPKLFFPQQENPPKRKLLFLKPPLFLRACAIICAKPRLPSVFHASPPALQQPSMTPFDFIKEKIRGLLTHPHVKFIFDLLGKEAWLTGGAIKSQLHNKKPRDYDWLTSFSTAALKEKFLNLPNHRMESNKPIPGVTTVHYSTPEGLEARIEFKESTRLRNLVTARHFLGDQEMVCVDIVCDKHLHTPDAKLAEALTKESIATTVMLNVDGDVDEPIEGAIGYACADQYRPTKSWSECLRVLPRNASSENHVAHQQDYQFHNAYRVMRIIRFAVMSENPHAIVNVPDKFSAFAREVFLGQASENCLYQLKELLELTQGRHDKLIRLLQEEKIIKYALPENVLDEYILARAISQKFQPVHVRQEGTSESHALPRQESSNGIHGPHVFWQAPPPPSPSSDSARGYLAYYSPGR